MMEVSVSKLQVGVCELVGIEAGLIKGPQLTPGAYSPLHGAVTFSSTPYPLILSIPRAYREKFGEEYNVFSVCSPS